VAVLVLLLEPALVVVRMRVRFAIVLMIVVVLVVIVVVLRMDMRMGGAFVPVFVNVDLVVVVAHRYPPIDSWSAKHADTEAELRSPAP